ncbi:MAG TPA: hypothetical protein VJC13_00785 [Candidatus Paceibacterota bacterium]
MISWKTIEYLHQEKTSDWYWIVGIVTVSIALVSVILNNLIFAILILVASFTLSLFASRRPEIIQIDIDDKGVTIGKNHYKYADLESFWIETREHIPKVLLKSKKTFMPFIVIFIEDIGPDEIHEVLSQHLPEEEHTEPFLEKLLLYFGF